MELELAAAQCCSSSSTDNSQDSDSQYSAIASHIMEDEAAGKSPVLLLSPPPYSVFMSEIEVWFNEENGAEADLGTGEIAGEIEGKTKIIFILNVSKSPPHLSF